jgi:hypothetical protein
MDQRQIVRMIAVGRVVIGVLALAAPRRIDSSLFGVRSSGALTMATRMLGARDLVLGLGTLRALDQDVDPATWAKAGAAADGADAVAAVLALGRVPASRALPTTIVAAASAALSARASTRLA